MNPVKILAPAAVLLLLSAGPLAQTPTQQQQQQPPPAQEQQDPPPPPPRIVGQAQTQEEFDAYQAISAAVDKVAAAEGFMAAYPDSGLTAYVHQLLAHHYDDAGDFLNFATHANKALEELPDNAALLTRLAFVSAERGQTSDTIIEQAHKAVEVLPTLEKPEGASPEQWVQQRMQLQADASYAIGRTYLNKFTNASAASEDEELNPDLEKAIASFENAIAFDPRHDYAYFRLGFAQTNANNAEAAINAYVGAVATGGVAAGPAQERLQQIHEFIQANMADSEFASKSLQDILAEGAAAYQERVAAKQQELAAMAEEIRQKEAAAAVPPPGTPPPPSP